MSCFDFFLVLHFLITAKGSGFLNLMSIAILSIYAHNDVSFFTFSQTYNYFWKEVNANYESKHYSMAKTSILSYVLRLLFSLL